MQILPKFIRHAIEKSYNSLLIQHLNLFDKDWYVSQYPCVKDYKKSPLSHYLKVGYKQNYNPSTSFSTERYTCAYPDVKQSYSNPLLHYIKKGRKQGRFCYSTMGMGTLKPNKTHQQPLISIIVTSYNYEQYIIQTLDSLTKQTYRNFEVIVVDDGSKDNSVNVIKEYIAAHNNIQLYTHLGQQNKGLVPSMQLGIEKAKGTYIAFCESDDYWAPEYLEKKVEVINKYDDVAIISNDIQLFGDETSVKDRTKYIDDIKKLVYPGGTPIDIRYNKSMNYIPTLSSVMIRTDVLRSLNFSTPIPAWIDFWLYRQILNKHILYFVDSKLTFWRQHNSYNSPANSEKFSKKLFEFISSSDLLLGIKTEFAYNNEIKAIEQSTFFDEQYYLSQMNETVPGISAATHYYYIGWRIGLEPSERFSGKAYLAMYPDLNNADICPLVHYIMAGAKEKREILSISEAKQLEINDNDIKEIKNLHKDRETVLLISHELSLTGAPRALANMAYAIKEIGKVPVIISNKRGPLMKEIEDKGIICKVDYTVYSIMNNNDNGSNKLIEYAKHFDYIVFNTILSIPLVYKFASNNAQKICWIHEGSIGYHYCPHTDMIKDALKLYDKIYVVGEYCKQITRKFCDNNTVIDSLLYYIDDNKKTSKPEQTTNNGKMKMVLAGTIEKRKGQEVLLDSIKYIPENIRENIEIDIVGSTVEHGIYERLKHSKYKCLKLHGSVSHDTLLKLMKEMDILLCPSIDDPMPIVCTEAFMLSKPIIVGINTGTAALTKDGKNGYVIKNEEPRTLAQTIVNAYNNRANFADMGAEGRKVFEKKFSFNSFYIKIKEIFN